MALCQQCIKCICWIHTTMSWWLLGPLSSVFLEFCLPSIPSSITVSAWQICLLLYLIFLSSPLDKDLSARHLLMHSGWVLVSVRFGSVQFWVLRLCWAPVHSSILFYLPSFSWLNSHIHAYVPKPLCTFTQLV